MDLIIFIKGFVVGFLLCAPVGPIGILCVGRTLIDGPLSGLASVLGASIVDALYCSIAGFGITFISTILGSQKFLVQLAGGFFLFLIGLMVFFSHPRERNKLTKRHGLLAGFGSAFLVMAANPIPILVFTATFTAMGVHGWKGDFIATAELVAGVFAGSAVWAPILVAAVRMFGSRFNVEQLRMANRVLGVILAGFGLIVTVVRLMR